MLSLDYYSCLSYLKESKNSILSLFLSFSTLLDFLNYYFNILFFYVTINGNN